MASLNYSSIKAGVFFKLHSDIYETLDATFSKKHRQKGSNQVRIKNLVTGAVVTRTLHPSDKPESVNLEKETYTFVYRTDNETVIHPEHKPSERITLPSAGIKGVHLIPPGEKVTAIIVDGEVLTLRLPLKVVVRVSEAPPSVKGDTTQGGSKKVVTETGATVRTPLFIEKDDMIRLNTETGNYVERVLEK